MAVHVIGRPSGTSSTQTPGAPWEAGANRTTNTRCILRKPALMRSAIPTPQPGSAGGQRVRSDTLRYAVRTSCNPPTPRVELARESPNRSVRARARPRRPTRECFVAFFGSARWPRMDSRRAHAGPAGRAWTAGRAQAGGQIFVPAIHGAAQSMEQEVGRPDGTGASSPRAPHRIVDTWWQPGLGGWCGGYTPKSTHDTAPQECSRSPSEFGPLSGHISFLRQGFPGYSRTSSSQKKLEARVLDPTQSHPTRNSHS